MQHTDNKELTIPKHKCITVTVIAAYSKENAHFTFSIKIPLNINKMIYAINIAAPPVRVTAMIYCHLNH